MLTRSIPKRTDLPLLAQLATSTPVLHAVLQAAKATTTTTTAKKTSGTGDIVLFLVVILGAGYFLYMRPRSRARLAQAQATQQRPLDVGDEVATSAGIVGRVRGISDDRVELEIAPGMIIQVLRKNVGLPLPSSVISEPDEDSGDHWNEHSASVLAPGGLQPGSEDDGDDEGIEKDSFTSYEGPAATPASATSASVRPSGRAAPGAAKPAPGAPAAGSRNRNRRRPAGAAPASERPPGWSITSDDAGAPGGDGSTDSPAAGSGR